MAAVPEILLALSGHESPICDSQTLQSNEFISASEIALFEPLIRLARLHQAVRSRAHDIASLQFGSIARSIALRINTVHLKAFQQAVLEFESSILSRDSGIVGAYDNVPLSSVVSYFDPWRGKLEWLWEVVSYINSSDRDSESPDGSASRSGAAIIGYLRRSSRTGYPDIESIVIDLTEVAERIWLKQLASWLLQSSLDESHDADFFVRKSPSNGQLTHKIELEPRLYPEFLSPDTAASALYVVKLLNQIDMRLTTASSDVIGSSLSRFAHIQALSTLSSPISRNAFAAVISGIRSSLVRELAEGLLPTHQLIGFLAHAQRYFLVGFNGFTDTLICEADKHVRSRYLHLKGTDERMSRDLAGLMIKDTEFNEVLHRTLVALAPAFNQPHTHESDLDWARSNLHVGQPQSEGA